LSLGRNHKVRRKPYSESEEYDTDTSGEHTTGRGTNEHNLTRTTPTGTESSSAGGNQIHDVQQRNNLNRYSALRYRQQFNL
jgi:hypothetical protein